MKPSLEYDFDLRLDENEDGHDLNIRIDQDGITISDIPYKGDGTIQNKGTGYVQIRHDRLEAIIEAIRNYQAAAKAVGVEITND